MIEAILPIEHSIRDGLYTRVAYARAGQLVAGCGHLKGGLGFLLTGSIRQIDGDTRYDISAPKAFRTSKGSQRQAYAITDCTYMTVHSVISDKVEDAEKELFDCTPQITRIRNSYSSLLLELKKSDEDVQEEMSAMPTTIEHSDKYYLGQSSIHGIGVFSKIDFKAGDVIAMAILDGERLATARFTNHSDIPNAMFVEFNEDSLALVALSDIPKGYEILVDYRRNLKCQQQ